MLDLVESGNKTLEPRAPLLEILDLSVRYRDDEPWVFEDLDCIFRRGRSYGILGGNGSGKSTLAAAILGIIPYLIPGEVQGDIICDGKRLRGCDLSERLSNIGYAFQDYESQVVFGDVSHHIGLREAAGDKEIVRRAIDILNLEPLLDRATEELSRGQMQRVVLAGTLRRDPDVIIYDEAVSSLDVRGRKQFGKLTDLLTDQGKCVCLLGQRSDILEPYTDEVFRLQPPSAVVGATHTGNGHRSSTVEASVQEVLSAVRRPEHLRYGLNLEKVRFTRDNFELGPLSAEIEPGEVVAVLGPNGSGKSTLFSLIAGINRPSLGEIRLGAPNEEVVSGPNTVSLMPEYPNSHIIGATVSEELELASGSHNIVDWESLVAKYFPFLKYDQDPLTLSFGQQRLLTMFVLWITGRPIALVEEPELGLDEHHLEWVLAWLRHMKEEDEQTVLISTHDMKLAADVADQALLLDSGKLVARESMNNIASVERWYLKHTTGA